MSGRDRLRLARGLALGALAVLALVSLLTGIGVEARADYGSGPHCSSISSSTHGAGSYACHNHAANYWVATSTFRSCAGFSTEEHSCSYHYRSCRRSTPSEHQCGSFYTAEYLGTSVTGPFKGDPIDSSVTIAPPPTTSSSTTTSTPTTVAPTTSVLIDTTTPTAPPSCGSGQHRHTSSGSCHSHPSSCGWYHAISGSGHSWVWGGSCGGTTTTVAPTTTSATATTSTAPPPTTTTTIPNDDTEQSGTNSQVH